MYRSLKTVKFLLREIRNKYRRFYARFSLSEMGINCTQTTIFIMPDTSRLRCGKGCAIGYYSIIDISDDPTKNSHSSYIELGDKVYIGDHCNIRASGSSVEIGSGTMIANSVTLVSANHCTSRDIPMYLQPWDISKGGVKIGEDCWIGANSVVLPGSIIPDGVIIAAGAVVRGELSPYSFWGGVPARFLKER